MQVDWKNFVDDADKPIVAEMRKYEFSADFLFLFLLGL